MRAMSRKPDAIDEAADTAASVGAALRRLGLLSADGEITLEPLTGGVSSDIWKARVDGQTICVKRALAKLRVAQDWYAPVGRNAAEVAWLQTAARIVPEAVPAILGHDAEAGLFAMAYLDPASHPVWKAQLLAGTAEPETARQVGDRLGRIHAATAGQPDLAAAFANDATFHAIRLEPYLEATARVHPVLAPALLRLVATTAQTRRVLIHGDVSPKNILVGPDGPLFLDAECACYGDPAFDLAFCLNHLLLKCLARRPVAGKYLACFASLATAYLDHVDWESVAEMEARTARLLPGLFLARVDGKSPVEYLTDEADKARVRRTASALLLQPVDHLAAEAKAWTEELDG